MDDRAPTRILVIGNYSGRNAGDAAILDGLIRDVTETFPERHLLFEVPTINPWFIRREYEGQPVRPVGLLPWNLSVKILGVPIVRAALRADIILVTDAVLFDRKLYNPLFNYLHTLSWVLPMAARRGTPVVLYNVTLGVVHTRRGKACLKRVLESARQVIVRDPPSVELAKELVPERGAPLRGADSALSTTPVPDEELHRIARREGILQSGRPVLGFNVNTYMEDFLGDERSGLATDHFQETVARVLDRAVRELEAEVVMIQTHPMDAGMADGVLDRVEEKGYVGIIRNPPWGHRVLTAILARAEAAVSMRTHVLILGSMVRTPVAGLIAYPKSLGYLESIGMKEMALEFRNFGEEPLWELVRGLWDRRTELRERLGRTVPEQQALAAAAARELSPWLGPPARLERAPAQLTN